ncbi:hypothetical protein MMC30_006883 [Trapelia coarctata]|nr:hypothetical protein [Trapelia coarctata]
MAEEVLTARETDAHDNPPASCGVKYDRDCVPVHGCVVSAITNMVRISSAAQDARCRSPRLAALLFSYPTETNVGYLRQTSRIGNDSLSKHQQYEALKFLLHFIGDIHQPLHTEAGERGGNGIPVLFNKKHTNLHSIWDTEMPEKHVPGPKADEKEDAMKWAEQLSGAATQADNTTLDECTDIQDAEGCALVWATEANTYVCSYVLKDDVEGVKGKNLAGEYYDGAVPIIDHLVGKAGLRLAGWINALAAAGPQAVVASGAAPLVVQAESDAGAEL